MTPTGMESCQGCDGDEKLGREARIIWLFGGGVISNLKIKAVLMSIQWQGRTRGRDNVSLWSDGTDGGDRASNQSNDRSPLSGFIMIVWWGISVDILGGSNLWTNYKYTIGLCKHLQRERKRWAHDWKMSKRFHGPKLLKKMSNHMMTTLFTDNDVDNGCKVHALTLYTVYVFFG